MCEKCEKLAGFGTENLDYLLEVRRESKAAEEAGTPTQQTIFTANAIRSIIDSEEAGMDGDVQAICLMFAVAVERLLALQDSGITT